MVSCASSSVTSAPGTWMMRAMPSSPSHTVLTLVTIFSSFHFHAPFPSEPVRSRQPEQMLAYVVLSVIAVDVGQSILLARDRIVVREIDFPLSHCPAYSQPYFMAVRIRLGRNNVGIGESALRIGISGPHSPSRRQPVFTADPDIPTVSRIQLSYGIGPTIRPCRHLIHRAPPVPVRIQGKGQVFRRGERYAETERCRIAYLRPCVASCCARPRPP